jgi:hypothetical protein
MQDSDDNCCHHLITRSNATWERIKPISHGIKKKCEIFAPKANQIFSSKAKVTTKMCVSFQKVVANKRLLVNVAIEEELEDLKDFVFTDCALLSKDELIGGKLHQSMLAT